MDIKIVRTVNLALTESEAIHLYNLLEIAKQEITFPENGDLGSCLDSLLFLLRNGMPITVPRVPMSAAMCERYERNFPGITTASNDQSCINGKD